MKLKVLPLLLPSLVLLAFGAVACQRKPVASASTPVPTVTPADLPLTSPAGFTAALERRWSLADITRFCSPERRFWNGCQNLVTVPLCKTKGEVWEADLYKNSATGFDRVWWYAKVCDNHVDTYSLNVSRGEDRWWLEIGTLETLTTPPKVEPSSKQLCFADGDHSDYR